MRTDNFLVSAQQDRKSAKETNKWASRQTGGQTGWSSFGLLRAPRLERRQSARPLFSFDKMWWVLAHARLCDLTWAIFSFLRNKYVCVTTFLFRVDVEQTRPSLSCSRTSFPKFTTGALSEVPARCYFLARITGARVWHNNSWAWEIDTLEPRAFLSLSLSFKCQLFKRFLFPNIFVAKNAFESSHRCQKSIRYFTKSM